MSDVSPHISAAVEQVLAGMRFVEQLWPHNGHVVEDEGCQRALCEAPAGPWETIRSGVGYLMCPATGRLKELPPKRNVTLEEVVRDLGGGWTESDCDRCNQPVERPAWLVMPHSPHLIMLCLCVECAVEIDLDYSPVQWIS